MSTNITAVKQLDKYRICKMTLANQSYYVCLPTLDTEKMQMVVDFPEEYYKSYGYKEMIEAIEQTCNILYSIKENAIYILPNVTTYDVSLATDENDDHAYRILFNDLKKYVNQVYGILNRDKNVNIDSLILIITQTDSDKKLIDWLDQTYPGYYKNITLNSLMVVDNTLNDDGGWTTMGGPVNAGASLDNSNSLNKPKAKKLVPMNKHGYLNITFIAVIIVLSLVIGISLATLLVK